MMAVFTLSSCSEDDNTVDEYANWQERNDKAFADTLAYARQQIAAGSDEWKVILCYSLANQTPNEDYNGNTATLKYDDTDYIVMHVLDKGSSTELPIYTDSIQMSYRGRLLPTDSYTNGYVFDQTFSGTFDKATALPTKAIMTPTSTSTGFVDGFTTALLNMHVGDHVQVFIPANLGYGTTDNNSIPAYSMLRFELALSAIKHGKGKWITE